MSVLLFVLLSVSLCICPFVYSQVSWPGVKLKDFDELCVLCSSPRWLERRFEIDFMPKDLAPLRRALFVDFGPELMQRWSPRWLERRFAIDFVPKGLATLAYCFELALVELEDFGAPLVPRWPALLCASARCIGLSGGLRYMYCCLPACASVCLLPGFVRGVTWMESCDLCGRLPGDARPIGQFEAGGDVTH